MDHGWNHCWPTTFNSAIFSDIFLHLFSWLFSCFIWIPITDYGPYLLGTDDHRLPYNTLITKQPSDSTQLVENVSLLLIYPYKKSPSALRHFFAPCFSKSPAVISQSLIYIISRIYVKLLNDGSVISSRLIFCIITVDTSIYIWLQQLQQQQ